jgi:ABC-2 type transport system permease protein
MSATIFWHEFSTRWKSVMFWSVSLTGLIFLFLSIFQSFAEEAALIRQMMEKFPPALLEAFGMARTDLSSALLGNFLHQISGRSTLSI